MSRSGVPTTPQRGTDAKNAQHHQLSQCVVIHTSLGVDTNNVFGLLRRYGRDVAGAVVITDPDADPAERMPGVVPYSPEALEIEVGALDEHPLGLLVGTGTVAGHPSPYRALPDGRAVQATL